MMAKNGTAAELLELIQAQRPLVKKFRIKRELHLEKMERERNSDGEDSPDVPTTKGKKPDDDVPEVEVNKPKKKRKVVCA